jgi:N6-adenosine-specific RNA methylase IME4
VNPFADLPRNHFGAILCDPPWPFVAWSPKGQGRSGEAHYQTMTHADLEALPVATLAAPDCALFVWVVQTQFPQAVRLIEAWGFTLKSCAFCWIKGDSLPLFPNDVATRIGLGKWTRAEFEQCWLATRGAPRRLDAGVRQVIIAPRREHSRKPDEAYQRIERLVAGPYCELFARQTRAGWSSWGAEINKFSTAELARPSSSSPCATKQSEITS